MSTINKQESPRRLLLLSLCCLCSEIESLAPLSHALLAEQFFLMLADSLVGTSSRRTRAASGLGSHRASVLCCTESPQWSCLVDGSLALLLGSHVVQACVGRWHCTDEGCLKAVSLPYKSSSPLHRTGMDHHHADKDP